MNKRTRRQKRESPRALGDKLFRLMVEKVANHAITGLDPEGRIFSRNAGAEKIFGYLKEEIIGENFSILFTPEDRRLGMPGQEFENARTGGGGEDRSAPHRLRW
jgi:PAS domain S-box-containing protein